MLSPTGGGRQPRKLRSKSGELGAGLLDREPGTQPAQHLEVVTPGRTIRQVVLEQRVTEGEQVGAAQHRWFGLGVQRGDGLLEVLGGRREVLSAPEHLPEGSSAGSLGPSDDRDQLVRALALLSPRQRRIVVLRHFVGLPEAEVAAELGVSVGTVKSTASRSLATLRTALTSNDPTARSAR